MVLSKTLYSSSDMLVHTLMRKLNRCVALLKEHAAISCDVLLSSIASAKCKI